MARAGLLLALGSLLPIGAANCLSAQGPEEGPDRLRPLLGDHRFIPNNITRDPFSRTFVRNSLGIGQALDIQFTPRLDIGGGDTIPGLSGDLLFAVLDFEYQYAVKDWMAVWGKVNLVGRLGTDVGAILSQGATVLTGFELGWLIRLVETEKVGLSATANLWNNSFTGVNFADWIEGIIEDEQVPLVRDVPSVRAGGGLRFAWAASDLVGVLASTEIGVGESVARRGEDQVSFQLAGAVDLDLYARTSVPLGFALGFETTTSPREGSELTDRANRGFFRIAYTGREDFVIAIDSRFSSLSFTDEASEDENIDSGSLLLNMRYYF
jgi:hypothetical protein